METPEPGCHVVSSEGIKTTMGDHGRRTLVGGLPLELEPPGLSLMARIGREVDSDPIVEKRVGLRQVRVLALMVNAIGDDRLENLPLAERVTAVGQLGVADWHYIAALQLAATDAGKHTVELDDDERCPQCKATLPKRVSVNLHEIVIWVYDEHPVITYRFADEWRLHTKPVQEVKLSTPRLVRAIENADEIELSNTTLQEIAWVAASITHVDGRPSPVTSRQLAAKDDDLGRGMTPRDWTGLRKAFNDAMGGVSQLSPWVHEPCGEKLWIPVGWADVFFGFSRG